MGKQHVRGPWGLTNRQFAAKMRRLPSRLQLWEVHADRLTDELRRTRVMLKEARRAYMMLLPEQRKAEQRQYNLTAQALDAHIESVTLELQRTKTERRVQEPSNLQYPS